jgi:hypothetical protein
MVAITPRLTLTSSGPPNTGDKLRGARPSMAAHDDSGTAERADYHAAPRLQPPLVCFIPLFYSAERSPTALWAPAFLNPARSYARFTPQRSPTRPGRVWHGARE